MQLPKAAVDGFLKYFSAGGRHDFGLIEGGAEYRPPPYPIDAGTHMKDFAGLVHWPNARISVPSYEGRPIVGIQRIDSETGSWSALREIWRVSEAFNDRAVGLYWGPFARTEFLNKYGAAFSQAQWPTVIVYWLQIIPGLDPVFTVMLNAAKDAGTPFSGWHQGIYIYFLAEEDKGGSVSFKTLGERKKRFAGQKDSESWRKLHGEWRRAENFRRWQKKLTNNPNGRGRGRRGTGIFRTWNQRFQVITPKGRAAQAKLCRVDRTNRERERVALLKEKAAAKLQKARDVLEARIERMKLSRLNRESAIKEIRFNAIRRRQKIQNDLRLEKQRSKVREAKLREQKKRCAPAPRRRGRVRRRRLTSRGRASRRRKGISAVKRK